MELKIYFIYHPFHFTLLNFNLKGAKKGGLKGGVTGVGKGLYGLVMKPVAGSNSRKNKILITKLTRHN